MFLLINIKKDLFYGNGWFRVGGMDGSIILILVFLLVIYSSFGRLSQLAAGSNAVARAARLRRIATASWWIQLLLGLGFLVSVYSLLTFFMGWPFFSKSHVRMPISHNHIYSSPAEMPGEILWLWLAQVVLVLVVFGVLFSLFGLYRRGQLFTARNVSHIRALGYFLIINWALDDLMQSSLHDMDLSMNPIFIGLLVIFIAWIMDEGRKIQEEQELTV